MEQKLKNLSAQLAKSQASEDHLQKQLKAVVVRLHKAEQTITDMREIADATKDAHSEELQEAEERAAVASIHARINGEKEARKKQQLSLEVQTRKIWQSQAGPALPGSVAAEEEVGDGSKLRPHEVAGAIEGEIARLEGEKRRRAEERVQERVRGPATAAHTLLAAILSRKGQAICLIQAGLGSDDCSMA